MQKNIEYNKTEKCFLLNKKIKLDSEYIENLVGKRNLEDLIKLEDNLYYYKNKSLIEILYNISNYKEINFKNNDTDDYRFNNLEIKLNEPPNFIDPPNVTILKKGTPKLITSGAYAGQYRNMYWKIRDNQNIEYYIMHINDDIFAKFSIQDKHRVFNFNNERPTWYLHSGQYIASMFPKDEKKITVYLHQYIMNVHFEDNTNMKKTVDHINRDKLDNRIENLRFANMSEQNSNRDKQKRQKNACELPEGIQQKDLPIYVCYHKRCYDIENNSWREFFTIDKRHPKLDKSWESSKSNNVTIKEKLDQTKLKLKHLNGEITNEEYKKISEPNFKLFKGLRLSIDKKYNKYKFEYENRSIKPCINYKMVLTHNDLQLMIDKFIDLLNDKYKDNKEYNKMAYYKLEKPVILDFSSVNNEIIEDDLLSDLPPLVPCIEKLCFSVPLETNNDIQDSADDVVTTQHTIHNSLSNDSDNVQPRQASTRTTPTVQRGKYTVKPDVPDNFSLYKEKDSWYLSFSKSINTIRHSKKIVMKCMCIQTELDRLIDEINESYPDLNIQKYTVQNPYDFTDNKPLKENNKPVLPDNFSICHVTGKDHIQFSKTIDDKKISYKKVIKSYDLQKELDNFVNYLNQEYKLNITEQKVIDLNNWKTSNKVN
jgi:hypothetical protein